jgi:hypothetical protein
MSVFFNWQVTVQFFYKHSSLKLGLTHFIVNVPLKCTEILKPVSPHVLTPNTVRPQVTDIQGIECSQHNRTVHGTTTEVHLWKSGININTFLMQNG